MSVTLTLNLPSIKSEDLREFEVLDSVDFSVTFFVVEVIACLDIKLSRIILVLFHQNRSFQNFSLFQGNFFVKIE